MISPNAIHPKSIDHSNWIFSDPKLGHLTVA